MPHSKDVFTESRDFWWNKDFLLLFKERWNLKKVKTVLDVGCGEGHWIKALTDLFDREISFYGVDVESAHIRTAQDYFARFHSKHNFKFKVSDVYSLSFPDNLFDMVTCQTLMIHLQSPVKALQEMVRVVKPGGLIAIAEPNNLYRAISFSVHDKKALLKDIIKSFRTELYYEIGKVKQGKGNDHYGEYLIGDLHKIGLQDIKVYLSDKCNPLFPPYNSDEQKIIIKELKQNLRSFGTSLSAQDKDFILAGGGDQDLIKSLEADNALRRKKLLSSLRANEYWNCGAALMFLISGRKANKSKRIKNPSLG